MSERDSTQNFKYADELFLVEKLKSGDEAAFRTIVETKKDMIYNTVLGFLQNPEDAEDVSQDVFLKFYESINQFKGESALSTWLYRIAVTKALEHLRSKKRKKRFAYLTALFGTDNELRYDPPDFHHPGVQLDNKEKAAMLFKALAKLPENQKIAFTLHKIEGVSYQEISQIMNLSVSAVESLIHRAKGQLRKLLELYYQNSR